MAEGLLRARFEARGRGSVASAGLAALEGRGADPDAVALLAARGIDLFGHRARQLTPALLTGFDVVLVMEDGHRREVEALAPALRGRVHRLGRFGGFDIEDPYRRGRAAFEAALAKIESGIDAFDAAFWSKP